MSNEILRQVQEKIAQQDAVKLAEKVGASRRWIDKVAGKEAPESFKRFVRLLAAVGVISSNSDQNG